MDQPAKGVVWREVPGTAGRYQVSDEGSVKSVERRVWNSRGFWATRNERLLKPSLRGPQGYAMVRLYMPDRQKRDVFVHRLVPVSYTHLTLPTIALLCRSRWSPYH